MRSFIWFLPEYAQGEKESKDAEYFAENAEWFIRKCGAYGFAAKGGYNREPHNHNDIGTFILAKDGRQAISDIGAGIYTRQYFKPETRYGHFHCSSRGHNVPMIGENLQKFGEEFKCRDFRYENGVLSMDIAPAYGLDHLKSLVRAFSFTDRSVTLTDTYDLSEDLPLTERLITLEKPALLSEGKICADGVTVTYDPSACTVVFLEEHVPAKTVSKDEVVYMTDFKLKEGVRRFSLTMEV